MRFSIRGIRRLPSLLLVLAAVLVLAPEGRAQVYGIWLIDAKAEKKYRKHLTELGGEKVLVCEPLTGIRLDTSTNTIHYHPENNRVLVADPADPTFVPYSIVEGKKKPRGRKSTVTVQGKHIARVQILMRNQSLLGLSREYGLRREMVDGFRKERDANLKGSAEWMRAQQRLLASYEKLLSWLSGTTYTVAAVKLGKEIAKERKRGKGEAVEERLERALASVTTLDPPEALVTKSEEITGGQVTFGMAESEHVRMIYDRKGVDDTQAKGLLTFAEKAIDGFRREFVDPYLSEDYPDHIPDRLFLEFWIGPDNITHHERFYAEYYGLPWGDHKVERLAVRGQTKRRDDPPEYLDYGKREDHDLMGVVSHRVGHVLAALHFNANIGEMKQDWLEEAVAYHISFEYFGRNEETCYAFKNANQTYAARRDGGDEKNASVLLGERYLYTQLALEKGRKIDRLAPMKIYGMVDSDLAKGWSFWDYVARKEGKAGQQWLRLACALSREQGARFVPSWREQSAPLFGLSAAEIFNEMEKRWRAHAEEEQRKGL
jgi:hypothetical protein